MEQRILAERAKRAAMKADAFVRKPVRGQGYHDRS